MAEYAYTQNDNEIKVQFQEGGVAKDLSSVSKTEIDFFSNPKDPERRIPAVYSVDSIASAALFDLTDLANGNLVFKPDTTMLANLPDSRYYCRFTIFNSSYPKGLIWARTSADLITLIVSV